MRDPILFGDFRTALHEERETAFMKIFKLWGSQGFISRCGRGSPLPGLHYLGAQEVELGRMPYLPVTLGYGLVSMAQCCPSCGAWNDLMNLFIQTPGTHPHAFPFIKPMEGARVLVHTQLRESLIWPPNVHFHLNSKGEPCGHLWLTAQIKNHFKIYLI